MKIFVLGAAGMLGHKLCETLRDRFEVWGSVRGSPETLRGILPSKRIYGGLDVRDISHVRRVLNACKPGAVINAVGVVPQSGAVLTSEYIHVNALFPHLLADLCSRRGVRLLQISSDCVFSGVCGNYNEGDVPDPVDLYGRSKWMGEPDALTLRTSMVGWGLNSRYGLLEWFASRRGVRIKGYRRAIFSGLSTSVLSNLLGDILETYKDLTGVYHVSSTPISKYHLLVKLRDALGWGDIDVQPDDVLQCDRSLDGSRFTNATGWYAPDWDAMIEGLARERLK
jgi:dTDP-4-dehydrorhamnose reductase